MQSSEHELNVGRHEIVTISNANYHLSETTSEVCNFIFKEQGDEKCFDEIVVSFDEEEPFSEFMVQHVEKDREELLASPAAFICQQEFANERTSFLTSTPISQVSSPFNKFFKHLNDDSNSSTCSSGIKKHTKLLCEDDEISCKKLSVFDESMSIDESCNTNNLEDYETMSVLYSTDDARDVSFSENSNNHWSNKAYDTLIASTILKKDGKNVASEIKAILCSADDAKDVSFSFKNSNNHLSNKALDTDNAVSVLNKDNKRITLSSKHNQKKKRNNKLHCTPKSNKRKVKGKQIEISMLKKLRKDLRVNIGNKENVDISKSSCSVMNRDPLRIINGAPNDAILMNNISSIDCSSGDGFKVADHQSSSWENPIQDRNSDVLNSRISHPSRLLKMDFHPNCEGNNSLQNNDTLQEHADSSISCIFSFESEEIGFLTSGDLGNVDAEVNIAMDYHLSDTRVVPDRSVVKWDPMSEEFYGSEELF